MRRPDLSNTPSRPRCQSVARMMLPGGQVMEVQCVRSAWHRGGQGGHHSRLDLLDPQNNIIRCADGSPLLCLILWKGVNGGVGIKPEIQFVPYDRKKHGTVQDGTFDLDAYLNGTLPE